MTISKEKKQFLTKKMSTIDHISIYIQYTCNLEKNNFKPSQR
jgi:hypothetical protein